MKLHEELRSIKEVFPCIEGLLETAAQRIEDQRLWRQAWLDAEKKVELLTSELNVIKSSLQNRKEKERND
jgi:DNA-binding winged helix-turn-helix (wHTH) protein